MRIIGGLLVLYVHCCYSFDLMSYIGGNRAWVDEALGEYYRKEVPILVQSEEFWAADPLDPSVQNYAFKGTHVWSIFYHVSDPFWIWTLHFTFLGILVLFVLGLWTRVTSVLAWMICLSYIQRAPLMLFGMDAMMVILLFYLMIGPCGATLSLDRWLEIRNARRLYGPNYVPPVQPSVSANVALRGMQVHFCFIYMASGTSKLLGGRWWNGTALWFCYANYAFAPLKVGLYYDSLVFLCQHRWLWELAMTGGVVFTLFMEIGLPFLVWLPRWRWLMVGGAVLLHTGIGIFMGLTTFSLFMLCLVVSFIPPETIRYLLKQMKPQGKQPADARGGKTGARGKPALALTRM